MPPVARSVKIRNFVNEGSNKPCSISEFNEFWKACSEDEREQFSNEVDVLQKTA